jgi:hypothetical protein
MHVQKKMHMQSFKYLSNNKVKPWSSKNAYALSGAYASCAPIQEAVILSLY